MFWFQGEARNKTDKRAKEEMSIDVKFMLLVFHLIPIVCKVTKKGWNLTQINFDSVFKLTTVRESKVRFSLVFTFNFSRQVFSGCFELLELLKNL